MKIQLHCLVFLLLAYSVNTYSCSAVSWPLEGWVENSQAIYFGRVISIAAPQLDKLDHFERPDREDFGIAVLSKVVRIKVYETLKGKEMPYVETEFHWCGGGAIHPIELGKKALVFRTDHRWHIKLGIDKSSVLQANEARRE